MPHDTPTRIRVLRPDRAPVEGIQTLPTDLTRFFVVVQRVGRDPGLLLLTIRALRQRSPHGQPDLTDLLWILRTSRRRIRGWLETLSQAGLLVYDTTSEREFLVLEIAELGPRSVFEERVSATGSLHHHISTHLFLHVLPRVGRLSFVFYLYLLAQETSITAPASLTLEKAVEDLSLKSERHAERELARLRRKKLVATHPSGVLLLRDPPPLSPLARALLRFRARGVPREVRTLLVLLAIAFALLAPLVYLLFRPLP